MTSRKRARSILGLILLLAAALRIVTSLLAYHFTFDTGTVELMALHITRGARPLFFYGQHYMGALEAYIAAIFVKLLGPTGFAVSLSPILVSVIWVLGMYFLFCYTGGRRAGLVAAWTVAVPCWVILWYTVAPYGGYPVFWACGTWSLALALRLLLRGREASGWLELSLIGVLAGLGLWTNLQVIPYLAGAGFLCLAWMVRSGRRKACGPLLLAGVLFAISALPELDAALHHRPGRLAEWNFSWGYIKHTLGIAGQHTLRRMIFWRWHIPRWYMVVLALLLAAAVVAAALSLWRRRRDSSLMWGMAGIAVALVVEAVFYLPHSMASLVVPRYLVEFWSLFFAAAVALPLLAPQRLLRIIGGLVLAIFSLHFFATDIAMIAQRLPRVAADRASTRAIVQSAATCGASNVVMVGGHIFGLQGQGLTFNSADRIHFSSAFGERYLRYAQDADADVNAALLCEHRRSNKLAGTLADLGSTARVSKVSRCGLVCSAQTVPFSGQSVLPDELECSLFGQTEGKGAWLLDRHRETRVRGKVDGNSGIILQWDRPRRVCGLWLSSLGVYRRGLPESYVLEYSRDGKQFQALQTNQLRFAIGYTCGPRVYAKGYLGMCEIRFVPVTARALRLTVKRAETLEGEWSFNEVYLFESADSDGGAMTSQEEAVRIAEDLLQDQAIFVAADRWLSAQLWSLLPHRADLPPVYPRFDPRHPVTILSRRLAPYDGLVVAPARAIRNECLRVIEQHWGPGVVKEVKDFAHYSLIYFGNPSYEADLPELIWDGFTLLATDDINAGLFLTEAEMHAETPEKPAHRPSPGWLRPLVLNIGEEGDRRFLGFGWSRRETLQGRSARWTKHLEADLTLECGRRADLMVVYVAAPVVRQGMTQTLGLYVNGRFIGSAILDGSRFRPVSFLVPGSALRIGDNRLTLRAGFRTRVTRDRRELAVAVDRVLVIPLDRISAGEAVKAAAELSQ